MVVIDTLRAWTVCILYFLAGRFGKARLGHFFISFVTLATVW